MPIALPCAVVFAVQNALESARRFAQVVQQGGQDQVVEQPVVARQLRQMGPAARVPARHRNDV